MRRVHWTFDVIGAITLVAIILLLVGVIPFERVWVAAILLASQCEATFEIQRRGG